MAYEIKGRDLYQNGQKLHLLGVNVMGMEQPWGVVFGLGWAGKTMGQFVREIKDSGFNAVRLPITSSTFTLQKTDTSLLAEGDKFLKGAAAMVILDELIAELEEQGIRYIFDHHYIENGIPDLWYTKKFPESQWLKELEILATRYKGPGFIGIDTKNEPNSRSAKWGSGDPLNDWKMACAKAEQVIMNANPDIIVLHEATSTDPGLNEMAEKPLEDWQTSSIWASNRRSLSVHLYGPDVWQNFGAGFTDPSFPENMPAVWDKIFGNVAKKHNVIIGEWGGRYGLPTSKGDYGWGKEKDKLWQDAFAKYLREQNISSFYWTFTKDSGDTGGILGDDDKPQAEKVALIKSLKTPYTLYLGEVYREPVVTFPEPETDQAPEEETKGEEAQGIMRYFEYKHLPERLQMISSPFQELAELVSKAATNDPREQAVALRKLLEAKDAAVRACL